VPHTLAHNF